MTQYSPDRLILHLIYFLTQIDKLYQKKLHFFISAENLENGTRKERMETRGEENAKTVLGMQFLDSHLGRPFLPLGPCKLDSIFSTSSRKDYNLSVTRRVLFLF